MDKKDKKEMTKLQEQIYEFLKDSIRENKYPPSVREIAAALEISASSVQVQLNKLLDMGAISRDPDRPRTILINDDAFNFSRRTIFNVPILENATEIDGLFSDKNIEDYFPLLEESIGNNEVFIIKFSGNHLKKVSILDGDKLLINKQETANSGDIVMVYANNEIMIRRLLKENNGYQLLPENDAFKPIFVERIKIIGKVVGVFRKI
jgi:repressor LexA